MGSEQQQHSERCAECDCGVCAERVEWLTLRAVCPGNSIGDKGAEHLALALRQEQYSAGSEP